MTPTDILAAARLSPLSPVVPAREEWLRNWQGPVRDGEWNVPVVVLESFGPTCLVYGTDPTGEDAEWELRVVRIRLDLRRPEVRDRLVRCGAPEWCRDSVAGMLAWALGGNPEDEHWSHMRDHETEAAVRARCIVPSSDGWYIPLPGGAVGWLPKENA